VTQLDNVLYIVTEQSPIIQTLSVDTLSSLGNIHVRGMRDPSDICHHDRQLYVADYDFHNYKYNCIRRVSADDHSHEKWLQRESTDIFHFYSLSVTSRGLLVTSRRGLLGLREYSMTDRQLLRVFNPSWNMKYLFHGVETTRGTFVICHRGTSQNEQQDAVSCRHSYRQCSLRRLTFIISAK